MSTQVRVHFEMKGRVRKLQLRIGGRPWQLNQGVANVPVERGKGYWMFWGFEGNRGDSVAITVSHGDAKLLEFAHEDTELPPGLGINAGTLYFEVPA